MIGGVRMASVCKAVSVSSFLGRGGVRRKVGMVCAIFAGVGI